MFAVRRIINSPQNFFSKLTPSRRLHLLLPSGVVTQSKLRRERVQGGVREIEGMTKVVARQFSFTSNSHKPREHLFRPYHPSVKYNPTVVRRELVEILSPVTSYLESHKIGRTSQNKEPRAFIFSSHIGVHTKEMIEWCAHKSGVSLFRVDANEVNYAKLQALFGQAKAQAPTIICIQNIDLLARKGEVNFTNQILEFISEMGAGVVFMATTTKDLTLDPGLFHTGRINKVMLPLADQNERRALLVEGLSGKKISPTLDLEKLILFSESFSDEKIIVWIERAAVLASQGEALSTEHFDRARELMLYGTARVSLLPYGERERVAFHEAGHVIVGHFLKKTLLKATLDRFEGSNGQTAWVPHLDLKKEGLLIEIAVRLGGRAAEELKKVVQIGSEADLEEARNIATIMAREGMVQALSGATINDVELILQEQSERALKIVAVHSQLLDDVANELMTSGQIDRSTLLALVGKEERLRNKS